MSKQSEALRDYFEAHGIPQKDICEAVGASKTTISNILAGRYGISKKIAHALARTYGFDVVYLITGEGSLVSPGGIRISQANNRNTGTGAGAIHVGTDAALRAENEQLRDRLAQAEEDKARLLGIIEKMTK